MAARKRLTGKKDWGGAFLAVFGRTGNVLRACEAVGVSRQAVYARRDTSPEFAAAWDAAKEDAADVLEEIAWERGKAQSDVLIIFLLKGLRPQKYRENVRQELTGANGGPVEIDSEAIRNDLRRRWDCLAAANAARVLPGDTEPE